MFLKSGLRLIGLHALLIAMTIQGLTPGTYTIVSPWALRRLDPCAAASPPDARYGRIPENDRPAPSNGTDHDEAPDEVVIPGGFRTKTILSRQPAIPSARPAWTNARHDPLLLAQSQRPAAPVSDPIFSLCRMTC
jgi:hypothetical protein